MYNFHTMISIALNIPNEYRLILTVAYTIIFGIGALLEIYKERKK